MFEGFEKIKNINSFYFYDKKNNIISDLNKNKIFYLGQKIKIKIKEVDFINRDIIYNIL